MGLLERQTPTRNKKIKQRSKQTKNKSKEKKKNEYKSLND